MEHVATQTAVRCMTKELELLHLCGTWFGVMTAVDTDSELSNSPANPESLRCPCHFDMYPILYRSEVLVVIDSRD